MNIFVLDRDVRKAAEHVRRSPAVHTRRRRKVALMSSFTCPGSGWSAWLGWSLAMNLPPRPEAAPAPAGAARQVGEIWREGARFYERLPGGVWELRARVGHYGEGICDE